MPFQTPRRTKRPHPCRYCGLVSDQHKHERGWYGRSQYECRDVEACGSRIRESKVVAGVLADTSDLPF